MGVRKMNGTGCQCGATGPRRASGQTVRLAARMKRVSVRTIGQEPRQSCCAAQTRRWPCRLRRAMRPGHSSDADSPLDDSRPGSPARCRLLHGRVARRGLGPLDALFLGFPTSPATGGFSTAEPGYYGYVTVICGAPPMILRQKSLRALAVVVVVTLVIALLFVLAYDDRGAKLDQEVTPTSRYQIVERSPALSAATDVASTRPQSTEMSKARMGYPPSGSRVPARVGRGWSYAPLDVQALSGADLYARLSTAGAVDSRTSGLAADFAELMSVCRELELERRILDLKNEPARSNGSRGQDHSSRNAEIGRACSSLPADALQRSDEWIAQAAATGDDRAQYVYATSSHWNTNPVEVYRNPEKFAAYKAERLEYLRSSVAEGNVGALGQLSAAYGLGVYAPRDRALGWAYAHAALRAQGKDTSALENALSGLSEQDQAKARREAVKIFGECCL